jgi:HlyD family secretion protein
MTANQKRFAIWLAIAASIAAALVFAFLPKPVLVDLVEVRPGPMVVTLDEEGETRVHDIYTLSAPIAGRVLRIDWHVGDPVVANESVLARIEPADSSLLDPRSEAQARATIQAAEAARDLAEAAVADAEAQHEYARLEYARMQDLIVEGSISRRDLDGAQRDYRASRAGLDSARAALQMRTYELEVARAQLVSPAGARAVRGECECVPIVSPVSGSILQIPNQSERVVRQGDTLLQIGNPADLEIVVDYLSNDAVQIEAGQRVIIDNWGGGRPLDGRVRLVEPYGFRKVSALGIEEQRVNVVIDFIDAEGRERLGHGYQLETRVVLWSSQDALTVPLTALFRDGEAWAVFIDSSGRARLRHVTIGRRDGVVAEVLDGLDAGTRVIAHPSDRVSEGVRIKRRG